MSRDRVIAIGTVLVMVALGIGFAAGTVFSSTPVTQHSAYYEGGNGGITGYGAPSLSVSTSPGSCVTSISTGTTEVLVLSNNSGTCTSGNFAELFSFSFSGSSGQTNTFVVTSQVGSFTPTTTTGTVTTASGTTVVQVYVDFGGTSPPSQGITVLNLLVR